MDEEASQAAYCLLAMSRAVDRRPSVGAVSTTFGTPLGKQTVIEQQQQHGSSTATAIPAASPPRNAVVALHGANYSSPFMIARILTDLTRVRQDLVNVQPFQTPSCKPSNQQTSSI